MKYEHPIVCDQQLFDFVESLEGFRSKPYKDKYSYWTIGIGHNLTSNPLHNHILHLFWPLEDQDDVIVTQEEAFRRMQKDSITHDQSKYILNDDLVDIDQELHNKFPRYQQINDDIRKMALLYMGFNLGVRGLLGFKKFGEHMARKRYPEAAGEIVNSQWYKQVPRAAKCIETMIRYGYIPKLDDEGTAA
jgi:GH24 family phage-related lysozyme (muramidase)